MATLLHASAFDRTLAAARKPAPRLELIASDHRLFTDDPISEVTPVS